MKTRTGILIIIIFAGLVISSCSKKSSSDPYSAPFAKETVDQGKANLSDAGQEMISQMSQMKDLPGASVIQSFVDCSSISDPASLSASSALSPVFSVESVISGNGKLSSIYNSMQASGNDPQTLQEFFDTYKGDYTWNAETQQWTKSADNTAIIFNFPKVKGGSTNDAQMKMTYTGVTGTSVLDNYSGDLPASLDITFSVSNSVLVEYSFTASYNKDGIPTSLESFFAIYPFKMGVSWSYSSSEVAVNYYFRNNNKSIIELGGGVGGKFDKNNLDTASTTESILYNANAHFQVLNIKLAGRIDYKALAKDMNNAETLTEDSLIMKAEVKAINKDASLVLVYADSNTKIAEAEAYLTTYEYWPGYTEYSTDIRFVFSDGTKGDMQSYFSAGFTDVVNSFNSLMTDMQTKFGSK